MISEPITSPHSASPTEQEVAPSSERSKPAEGSSFDADMDTLTSRLGSMAVLLEGSNQNDETDKLLEAMSAISLDPEGEQQRQPPVIGLRGAGAAFQVMGAAVAKDACNVFKEGKKSHSRSTAGAAAKDGSAKGENCGNRFSSSPRRSARIGKCKGRGLGDITEAGVEAGHEANKRLNRNRSPVWRTGTKNNDSFMKKHGYGYEHNGGNSGNGDGRGGDGGGGGGDGEGGGAWSPQTNDSGDGGVSSVGPVASAVVDADDGEITNAMWDDCMGAEVEEGDEEQQPCDVFDAQNNHNGSTAKSIRVNIVNKREQVEREQRMVLVLLYHVHTCQEVDLVDGGGEGCTKTKHCGALKRMWHHVKNCNTTSCPTAVSHGMV